jgi:hypothetical protein
MSRLENYQSKQKTEFEICKSKLTCDNKLTICMENNKFCQHRFSFGNSIFCTNPEKNNFGKKLFKDYLQM